MAKVLLSVGVEIPGGEVESIDLLSARSLLDADIVIFQPGIPSFYSSETYLGKRCLYDDDSFRVREAVAHWRRELAAALDAGKIVILVLAAPEVVYVGTGRKEYSGTGRNARTTRVVEQMNSYEAIPTKWEYYSATGTEMTLVPEARFLAPYWGEFEDVSEYRLYLEGDIKTPLIRTRSGGRIVAALARKGSGALIAIPALDLEDESFTETRKEHGKEATYWTKKAQQFGTRLSGALVAIADAIAKDAAVTPPPVWVRDDKYRVKAEGVLESQISTVSAKLIELEDQQRDLRDKLSAAGSLRRLLYEQGKPLEAAVLEALDMMGFSAINLKEGESEFDAVFQSQEGRFIGEVEGKDTRPINIDKFSQLERNLNEDFAREGVSEFAKGVLFGNAFRLRPVSEREAPFTEKCRAAAVRLGVALVHTPDLFVPCRYLSEAKNEDYAKTCREAILNTKGTVVVFPQVPLGSSSASADINVVSTESASSET